MAIGEFHCRNLSFIVDNVYRFFYADERAADGKNIGPVLSGPAHGDFFAQLAKHEGNVPWLATFVKDKGYVKF